MSSPLFSCVVPVKGARPYLDEALASLASQGMGDELEVIIQDGEGESGGVVSGGVESGGVEESGSGVRWIREADSGQSDAMNRGFAKARGEWLFWLNADDVLLPGALKKVRELILSRAPSTSDEVTKALGTSAATPHESTLSWIAGDEYFIDGEGRRVGCSVGSGWHDWLYRHAVPHVHGPSAFFRRELLEKVGGLDVKLRYCMDWDLWIKFMKFGARFERIGEFLWAQRRWPGSKTQRDLPEAELAVQQAEIAGMLKKNDFTVTSSGVFKLRLWRLVSGCYFKEWACGR